MPSCRPDVIPGVLYKLMKIKPRTILEIGIGHGKWGVLCKEYLKYWCKIDVKIDGIEAHGPYISEIPCGPNSNYRDIHLGDVQELSKNEKAWSNLVPDNYDLLLMVDVIEHLDKDFGKELLEISNNYLISTPGYWNEQGPEFGNEHERHISKWEPEDFANSRIIKDVYERPHILGWKK